MSVNKAANLRSQYEDLCRELNMDRETEDMSWKMFEEVLQRSTLEGEPLHWFCCALYAACRLSYTPTVGESNAIVMGNCISLNKMLRCCDISSISQFILKIKVWHEMANLPCSFLRQIERLERTPGITFHLYCRYNDIFEKLFISSRNDKKNTKYRSVARCSSTKLYDLCWCLYLCAKNEDPSYNMDIVTSFHLLLCCIDLIYLNVLGENRVDLVNRNFVGIPEKWGTSLYDPQQLHNHCIIGALCTLAGALSNDAKDMKENHCKRIFTKFFKTKTIHGNEETFLGIISNENFERNVKSLNSAYEQYVLSVGEFDERILLNNPNCRKLSSSDAGVEGHTTPYTRKHSLPNKEDVPEPVASATNNVKKLKDIAKISGPTEFISQAGVETLNKISEKLTQMQNEFNSALNNADVGNRFKTAESLFFYLLDKILRVETRTKPNINIKILLSTETFITTLIVCCVEIVLDAYQSQKKFPWVLTCFNISAYHFHKIIEIVVRSHDELLSRPLIKHLNCIEETCLESLAWKCESPLWDIIRTSALPTWSDVDVDNLAKRNQPQSKISKLQQSPNCSAYETFSSVIVNESTRRDLFNSARESSNARETLVKKPLEGAKPTASLTIFCRKFYKLAWIRLKELCRELKLAEEPHLNKLWTLFEYSITQRTELMQDRHLDQMLMCGIYLYIRVQDIKCKSFTDIMKFYRKQPQAQSRTYREVLIETADEKNGSHAKYRDIIYFYNNIYVKNLTPYALNFSGRQQAQQNVPLSPHPTEKQSYPRKLSNNLITVSRMEKSEHSHSPFLTYEFSKSPGKNLEELNYFIRKGKRNLPFTEFDGSDGHIIESKIAKKTPVFLQKCRGVLQDRQEDIK
ncbi:retinoblastoma family protein isoform X6 [Zeugodacus cucurbitae]|uniref:retinoblastoma family protein isoform X6 n=1 Tax=Zeugodacus cucurbitae TaxID=28588 RepID=UPI0010A748EE|nr:retinoblastoma family protein isoform X6 [Zeugodacus cucurbitae]